MSEGSLGACAQIICHCDPYIFEIYHLQSCTKWMVHRISNKSTNQSINQSINKCSYYQDDKHPNHPQLNDIITAHIPVRRELSTIGADLLAGQAHPAWMAIHTRGRVSAGIAVSSTVTVRFTCKHP
jgi:hypothetical protein